MEGSQASLTGRVQRAVHALKGSAGLAGERELAATLERHNVRAIDTADAKFDPHLHQAIAEVPAEGKPPGSIVNVVQTGYVIADRLLRPAMVTVARNPGNGGARGDSGSDQAVDTKA